MAMQSRKTDASDGRQAYCQIRAALAALLLHSAASAAMDWPTVAVPQGMVSFAMGGEVVVNGLPLRMRGVLSDRPPAQVAALFRASLGHPLVENTQGSRLVLGRPLGEFYATVQLEPAGAGTRGVVAVTRLGAMVAGRNAARESGQRILARFPPGTKLLSRMSSVDGLRRTDTLTLSNALGVELNVQHIRRTLSAQGYQPGNPVDAPHAKAGATLQFARPGAEAIASVYRAADGNTAIVLNTITELEHTK
ncbi:MAG: hypothetical protein V4476_10770 [Pseudomonadota bacterium]